MNKFFQNGLFFIQNGPNIFLQNGQYFYSKWAVYSKWAIFCFKMGRLFKMVLCDKMGSNSPLDSLMIRCISNGKKDKTKSARNQRLRGHLYASNTNIMRRCNRRKFERRSDRRFDIFLGLGKNYCSLIVLKARENISDGVPSL